ncbi:methyltransferase [uncultured Methanolobus sp.]|uniref:methyltransferase n=1 Tax=uncultured Methanolobus sp. TaxID=218300 RepID=UPI002AAAC5BD|nr:methyltransferase [uncultured Methanolobus sp.]
MEQLEKLSDMKPPFEDKTNFLRDINIGFEKSRILQTALELDIFSKLTVARDANKLSEELNTNYELTSHLLDTLVAMELLEKSYSRYTTPIDLAPFLVKDSLYASRYLANAREEIEVWMNLTDIIKNGVPETEKKDAQKRDYTTDQIEWIARMSVFGRIQATMHYIRSIPEFKRARTIIDLGGGHGLFGIGFAQENTKAKVTIFDMQGVIEVAEKNIMKYQVQNRVKAIAGDYLEDYIGSGYDLVFEACSFGGNLEQADRYYGKVADSLNEGGLFIIQTICIDDDGASPLLPLIWSLKDKMIKNGHTYMKTDSALSGLLSKSGLFVEDIIDMTELYDSPMKLVIARKRCYS